MSSVRRFIFPNRRDLALTDVLYALSDPTRLWIVCALAEGGEQPCCAAGSSAVPKSTLAHHFKVLRETGVVETRAEGTQSFNSLRRDDLDARFPGLLDAVLRAARACSDRAPSEKGPDSKKAPA